MPTPAAPNAQCQLVDGSSPIPRDEAFEARALGHVAADERREHGADVDAHVEEREAAVAPRVVLAVEAADQSR